MRPLNSTLLLNTYASPAQIEMEQTISYEPVAMQGASE